eukprot:CAMPEP_0182455292 /NCGR_PEP_ID=MMETSP1319-20130603/1523_1 /TAXON_ID=172717 /ORGANISM="Bolidomonas pacifica, Strain RCC208" /LENGTH=483 /DNA_ID=CAMNT_0024653335 /DNA_START=18 /DNA_END=1469 /DNA_ORIENTATION=+
MPLVKRSLAHVIDYAEPRLYQDSPDDQVLANVNQAGMTGAMTQLGYLASYATEMLSDLKDLADQLHVRVHSATSRTRALLEEIPRLQEEVYQADSSYEKLVEPLKQDLHLQDQKTMNQLFVSASVPAAVKARYTSEEVKPPPNFSAVEAAMTDAERERHGHCAKVYSDPQFFFTEWEREEEKRYKAIMEERAQKKKEKKARRAKEKALKEKERGLQKTVKAKKQLNWKSRYNVDDVGNMRVEQTISAHNNLVSSRQLDVGDVGLNAVDQTRSVQQAMRAGAIREEDEEGGGAVQKPQPPPRKPAAGGNKQPPPPPKKTDNSRAQGGQPPPPPKREAGFRPPPPPKPAQNVAPPVEEAPAPAPAPPPKRPMPPKAVMPKSALDMSVLQGIKGGTMKLKKAAPIVKRVDPKMNLLASIKKKGGGGLKHVDREKMEEERTRRNSMEAAGLGASGGFASQGINAILERRKFLAEESDDSDSDDDDWD